MFKHILLTILLTSLFFNNQASANPYNNNYKIPDSDILDSSGDALEQDYFYEQELKAERIDKERAVKRFDNLLSYYSIGIGSSTIGVLRDDNIYSEINILVKTPDSKKKNYKVSGATIRATWVEYFGEGLLLKFGLDYSAAEETIKKDSVCAIDSGKVINCTITEEDHEARFSVAQRIYSVKLGRLKIEAYGGVSANHKIKYIKNSKTGYQSKTIYTNTINNASLALSLDFMYDKYLLSIQKYVDISQLEENNDGKSSSITLSRIFKF